MLKLSLIIPVYNEERHIKACLDAISIQTVSPAEVIVVDNNCIDKTLEIAEKYDYVTVVKEAKQGLTHARNTGFDFACGDILARIDADTEIENNWVEKVVERFSNDEMLFGLTGPARTGFLPYVERFKSTFFSKVYFWYVDARFNTNVMWGANMAIRKEAWLRVKNEVTLDDSVVHEDQDISLWIGSKGMRIDFDKNLIARTDGQTYRYLPKLIHYFKLHINTRRIHKANGNLSSEKLNRLGFWHTFPGRMYAIIPSLLLIVTSIILFPVDYLVYRNQNNN
jgi:glycosyltransferase involved in cell wall biosynthesis